MWFVMCRDSVFGLVGDGFDLFRVVFWTRKSISSPSIQNTISHQMTNTIGSWNMYEMRTFLTYEMCWVFVQFSQLFPEPLTESDGQSAIYRKWIYQMHAPGIRNDSGFSFEHRLMDQIDFTTYSDCVFIIEFVHMKSELSRTSFGEEEEKPSISSIFVALILDRNVERYQSLVDWFT